MESNNKNKKNTVWIILTCVFALTTLVLGMALYRSQSAGNSWRVSWREHRMWWQ